MSYERSGAEHIAQTPPEMAGRIAFEHFLAYSAKRKPDFHVAFKTDHNDARAWESFVGNLCDLSVISGAQFAGEDSLSQVTVLDVDGVIIHEIMSLDESGELTAITYQSPVDPSVEA